MCKAILWEKKDNSQFFKLKFCVLFSAKTAYSMYNDFENGRPV